VLDRQNAVALNLHDKLSEVIVLAVVFNDNRSRHALNAAVANLEPLVESVVDEFLYPIGLSGNLAVEGPGAKKSQVLLRVPDLASQVQNLPLLLAHGPSLLVEVGGHGPLALAL